MGERKYFTNIFPRNRAGGFLLRLVAKLLSKQSAARLTISPASPLLKS